MKKYYSKTLNQHYRINADGTVTFNDGTSYNRNEMKILKGYYDDGMRAVHLIKKIFDGEIIDSEDEMVYNEHTN